MILVISSNLNNFSSIYRADYLLSTLALQEFKQLLVCRLESLKLPRSLSLKPNSPFWNWSKVLPCIQILSEILMHVSIQVRVNVCVFVI